VAGVPNATAALYVRRPGTNREYIPIEATSNPTIVYKLSPSDPDGIYQFYLGVKDADNFEVGGPFQPTFKTEPMEEITVDRTLPKVTVSALALFEDNGDAAVVEEPGVFRGGKNLRISWIVDDESPLAKVEPMHIEVSFDGGNSFTSLVGWAYLKVKENTDAPKKRQWNGEYIWKLPRLGSESHLLLKISAFDVVKNEGIGYSKKFRIRSFAPKKEDDVLAEEYLRKGRMFRDSKGDPDNLRKARNYFEDSLRYSKDDPETLLELAHVLRKLGEIKEALRVAERAKAKSNSYMLHHTLAVLYIDDGQLHDAGLEVEELLKAQSAPNLTNDEIKSICKLIIELADRCEQAGDLDAAVQYLTKITDNMSASVVEYYMNKAKDKINELNARLGSKRSDKGGDERFDD
jgi:tetratricopeptide (TPR) repeat protein